MQILGYQLSKIVTKQEAHLNFSILLSIDVLSTAEKFQCWFANDNQVILKCWLQFKMYRVLNILQNMNEQ